jgi:xylulokinase
MPGGALFLGVDVGTQGTKALVYEQKTGKVVSRGAKSYDILKTTVPGRAEQHPSAWIEVNLHHYTSIDAAP